jgi:hypothetical protein
MKIGDLIIVESGIDERLFWFLLHLTQPVLYYYSKDRLQLGAKANTPDIKAIPSAMSPSTCFRLH